MEEWESWIPQQGLSGNLYNEKILDCKEGLILEFRDEDFERKIIFTFDGIILSYRVTDEGCLLKRLYSLLDRYGDSFFSKGSLFKVKNSDYLKWFLEESRGIYTQSDVEHYVFYTPDEAIEVLSTYEPTINIQTQG
jgi:hypothetical protein